MFEPFIELIQHSQLALLITVFVLSLIIGSFLNVVIYRLPKMMMDQWRCECEELLNDQPNKQEKEPEVFNLAKPDSHCPSCNNKLKPWHNIPVISYLWLRGKCAYCQHSIAIRYPAIELLTAISSCMVAYTFGATMQTVLMLVVTWAFICLIFIDIDHMLLPDQITLPLLWLVLLASTFDVFLAPSETILGAAIGYLCLWLVYWGFKLITGKEGMGHGDFKLLAVIGAVVGWQYLPLVILMSSVVAAIIGLSMMATNKLEKGAAIPFGPYLAIAGWMSILWGESIMAKYLALIQ